MSLSPQEQIEAKLRRNFQKFANGQVLDFYEEVAASRFYANADYFVGFTLIAEAILFWNIASRFSAFGAALWKLGQLIIGTIGVGILHAGLLRMRFTYRDFCEHRIIPLGRRLHAQDAAMTLQIPKRRVFRKSADLKVLEKEFCEQMLRRFDLVKRIRKEARWKAVNGKHRSELIAIIETCHLAGEEKAKLHETILAFWESLPLNPVHRKRFLAKVESVLLWDAFRKRIAQEKPLRASNDAPVPPSNAEFSDWRLKLLEKEARDCQSEAARALCKQALEATDRRRRVKQRYESWSGRQFDTRTFYQTLSWLVREGVVFTKRKEEPVYSLQSNASRAKSDMARALIGEMVRLDKEIRN